MNNQLSKYGIATGILWAMSFFLTIRGMESAGLGMAGNITGVVAPFLVGFFIRKIQIDAFRSMPRPDREKAVLPFKRCLYASFMINIGAALVCTFAQYLYFRFLDKGFMMSALTSIYENPEYKEVFRQMLPGYSTTEVLKLLNNISISDLVFQLMVINFFLALFFTPFSAIYGKVRFKKKSTLQK